MADKVYQDFGENSPYGYFVNLVGFLPQVIHSHKHDLVKRKRQLIAPGAWR